MDSICLSPDAHPCDRRGYDGLLSHQSYGSRLSDNGCAGLLSSGRVSPQKAETAPPASAPPYLTKTTRLLVLGGAALITFLLYFFASGLHPLQLIVGQDNRYSNSKFQVALWFFVLITTYIAIFALRAKGGVIGQINIPEHLLLLSGMSAFTYAAAKGITTSKVNDAQAQGIADPEEYSRISVAVEKSDT